MYTAHVSWRMFVGSAVVALGCFLLWCGSHNHVHSQEPDGKKTEALLQFAEKFVVACSMEKEDPAVKNMVAYPFLALWPCKGGTAKSYDEFSWLVLQRIGGREIPRTFDKRKTVTMERYVRSFDDPGFSEEWKVDLIKSVGKGVSVVYLARGKNEEDGFAVAVIVRASDKGFRAVGIGIVEWREATGSK